MPGDCPDAEVVLPNAPELRAFAERFTEPEWFMLSRSEVFCTVFTTDLKRARTLAEKILFKLYRENKL